MNKTGQNKPEIRVGVTGIGIVSAIGNTLKENRVALFNTLSGIGPITRLDTIHAGQLPVGEVKYYNSELIALLKIPEKNNYSRTALLGALAAKEAVIQAGLSREELSQTALISATTVGGMDMTERYFTQFNNKSLQPYLNSHKASDSTEKIAEQLGITKFTTTISTACSSAANAVMFGSKLLQSGRYRKVIVGGTDALSKFTINGFHSLKILSDEICTPFDYNRKGLNLGEGAAYLVLETVSENTLQKPVLAYVTGYGNANDAHHQTASSENGDGAFKAMNLALENAKLNPQDIDYINAHGTATQNNDLSESIALKRTFGNNIPVFSSTKSLTGHTLAAAGALEAVFSILSLLEQKVPANFNFKEPIAETNSRPLQKVESRKIDSVLSNSFGFGGNCSALIFSKA